MKEHLTDDQIEIMKEIFSKALKEIRKTNGLTQDQMAEALGVTPGYISTLERKKSLPSYPLMYVLIHTYDFDSNLLFGKAQKTGKVINAKDADAAINALGNVCEMLESYKLSDPKKPEED